MDTNYDPWEFILLVYEIIALSTGILIDLNRLHLAFYNALRFPTKLLRVYVQGVAESAKWKKHVLNYYYAARAAPRFI